MDEEDLQIQLKVRKRIAEIYTKDETDFRTRPEYDDYIEEREDVIMALVSGDSLDEVEARIAKYKQENQESIHRHRRRKLEEAGANVVTSLNTLEVETTTDEGRKGLRGPQPLPTQSGHELAADGCLLIRRRAKTAEMWHSVASASGWTREHYSEFTRQHVLNNLSLKQTGRL